MDEPQIDFEIYNIEDNRNYVPDESKIPKIFFRDSFGNIYDQNLNYIDKIEKKRQKKPKKNK